MSVSTYPVHVEATLDRRVSRWLWLVKWLLVLPHYVVLLFLWIGFVAVSVIAFFAILFTGRYPRALFEFNVGVLRWSWRVSYYAYGALGTDQYPPFTLADVPDYPAHFEVEYPQHLSRGLVLVKWWLLAIPHYLVVGVFAGGGTWAAWQAEQDVRFAPSGLITLLVLIAAVALLFTGRYPQQIFDFVLGMNRWALRVAAYAGLMTDEYPPFRLDMGGADPSATVTIPPPQPPVEPLLPPAPPYRRGGWTAGRVVSLVAGVVVGLVSFALIAGGAVVTWATNTQRDAAGFLTSGTHTYATTSYAVTSDRIELGSGGTGSWATMADVLGTLRVRARSTVPGGDVFVGVASQSAVDSYLASVDHAVVTNWLDGSSEFRARGGAAPASAPAAAGIWSAQVSGPGTQSLTWAAARGDWVVVIMNVSGAPGVSVAASAGASVPDLAWIAVGLFAAGGVLLLVALALVVVPVVRASRAPVQWWKPAGPER